jgi:hypothetical protein
MAKTSTTIPAAGSGTTSLPGVVTTVNLQAYKMQYENNLLRHLCKPIGQGTKGGWLRWPYFDPTTFATAASVLTEVNDFATATQLTNASVLIVASEFGVRTDVTDRVRRAANMDIAGEASRQLGIGVAVALDKHILARMSTGFTVGTVTGTYTVNTNNGFTLTKYAAAQSFLAAQALTVPGVYNAVVGEYSWYYTALSTFSQNYASAMGDVGNDILNKWYKQRILGNIDVYALPLSHIAATSIATGYLFSKEGIGLWVDDDFHVEQQRDASARADELVATLTGGAKVLVAGYGARLKMNNRAPV